METQLTTALEVFLLSYLLRDYYIYIYGYSTVHTIIYHIEVYLLNSILYVYLLTYQSFCLSDLMIYLF